MSESITNPFTLVTAAQVAHGNGAIRIVVEFSSTGTRQEHVFNGPSILVGRHQRSDLRLDFPEISNRQLFLLLVRGGLFGVHLSSRVATQWDGVPQSSGWIGPETVLTIGPFALRFPDLLSANPTQVNGLANPLTAGSWPGPPVVLELQRGKVRTQSATVDRVLTFVGNVPMCKLRMNSSRVSSVHCALVRSEDGLRVIDLVSREGVRVNGNCVQNEGLRDGDALDLGGRQLVVRYASGERPPLAGDSAHGKDDGESFSPTEIAVAAKAFPPSSIGGANAEALAAIGPIIGDFFAVPPQSAEQFRAMMATMMQAFGMMYTEHRNFVKDEMNRLDDLIRVIAERHAPPIAQPKTASRNENATVPSPTPELSVPLPPLADSPAADQIHAWLQQRIEDLGEKRASFWERMAGLLRTKPQDTSRG